jgi:NAD(P)-dependent dehydrogenase (short-subunit alcohol dehydrogenase family)
LAAPPIDITALDAPTKIIQAAVDTFGGIDIMCGYNWEGAFRFGLNLRKLTECSYSCSINNAGFTWDGVIHKMSQEQWHTMLEVHCTAPFRLVQAAAPYMREAARKVNFLLPTKYAFFLIYFLAGDGFIRKGKAKVHHQHLKHNWYSWKCWSSELCNSESRGCGPYKKYCKRMVSMMLCHIL